MDPFKISPLLALIVLILIDTCASECCYEDIYNISNLVFNTSHYKNGDFFKAAKWPEGNIYYDFDPHMDPIIRHLVTSAIDYFNDPDETNGCIRWIQRRPDGRDDHLDHWVTISQTRTDDDFLQSNLGYEYGLHKNGHIYISYDYVVKNKDKGDLVLKSEILHEMMHVMGFDHEFTRWDRDCYVYVSDFLMDWDPDTFNINRDEYYYTPELPYDFDSVMHYSARRLTADFYAHDKTKNLGKFDGRLSTLDWERIGYMYCDAQTMCDWYPEDCVDMSNKYTSNANCFREGPNYEVRETCLWKTKCDIVPIL